MHLPCHSAFLLRLRLSLENPELISLLEENEKSGSKIIVMREEAVGMTAYLPIVQYHCEKGFVLISATERCPFISIMLCNIWPLLHIITLHFTESTMIAFCSL